MPFGRLNERALCFESRANTSMYLINLPSALIRNRSRITSRPNALVAALTSSIRTPGSLDSFRTPRTFPSCSCTREIPTIFYSYLTASPVIDQNRRSAVAANGTSSDSGNSNSDAGSRGKYEGFGSASVERSSTSWPPPLDEWLRDHGGIVNGVELWSVLFPSGEMDRQLRATTDHPAGKLLISVPKMLQIRYDRIEEAAAGSTDGSLWRASGGDEGTDLAIPSADAAALVTLYDKMPRGSDTGAAAWPFKQALTILYHLSRGSASPLLPYIAHLPGIAPGVPTPRVAMLMHDDAVEELQYGNIVQDVRNQKYWLRRVSTEVFGRTQRSEAAEAGVAAGLEVFDGLEVDSELLSWAASVAMSRCFRLTRFRTHTCVPLVDMANHVAPYSASNCEIRTGPNGEVNMHAKRMIEAGEELTLTYGTHDNHNLLLSYGFTLQPNHNDAFYFDLDLSTIESLVEGLMDGGTTGFAPWQLDLLEEKVGLRKVSEHQVSEGSGSSSSSSGGTIRIYLSATLPSDAAGGGGEEEETADGRSTVAVTSNDSTASIYGDVDEMGATIAGRSGAETSTRAAVRAVRQPVDPRLLAALRIVTLQDPAWHQILSAMSVDQIGGWSNLLARQQEITIMRSLAALVTALYTTFATNIQQDRQLLAAASKDAAPPTATATATTDTRSSPFNSRSKHAGDAAGTSWALRPSTWGGSVGAAATAAANDPSAAATAAHFRDTLEAIRFRLGLKTTLERCLQALVARAKQLDALQKVR